jgi:DNA (cytosine-5)-methyltransferase 1
MRFLSLFSGIEAASVAWQPLGWECVGVAEIEPFPCAVLKHRFPGVPNLGSVTEITEDQIRTLGHIDVVVYGFPCQDLSVAGKRKGLQDADGNVTRSGLFYTATRIIGWSGARWSIAENVPGLMSSSKGLDFASVVGELSGCRLAVPREGWANSGFALGDKGLVEWAILDAQYFGVAQRRRRVFIVRDTGNWSGREPLLLERESLQGYPAPRREAGEGVAGTIESRTNGGGFPGTDGACSGHIAAATLRGNAGRNQIESDYIPAVAGCLQERDAKGADSDTKPGHLIPVRNSGRGYWQQDDKAATLGTEARAVHESTLAVATMFEPRFTRTSGGNPQKDLSHCLRSDANTGDGQPCVQAGMMVRRLTVTECERLQGLPDGWTAIPWRGKPADQCPDGPRYKAIGNSMAVPVMRWIGERIADADSMRAL